MQEAPFSFTTKVNGDLLTIRGATAKEFEDNLAEVLKQESKIGTLVSKLQAATGK